MAWAVSRLPLALVPVVAFASLAHGDPQRPPARPPTVFAVPVDAAPSAAELAGAPAYPLGDATFRFAYTDTTLFIGASVSDDDLISQVGGDDDPAVAFEDAIEVLLDPSPGAPFADAVTRFVLSAAGGLYDARGLGVDEDATVDLASAGVEAVNGGWEASIAVDVSPAMLPAERGAVVGIDFAIHDLDGGAGLTTEDWSGIADLEARACWSRLELLGPGDPEACIGGYDRSGGICRQRAGGCGVAPGRSEGVRRGLEVGVGLGIGLGLAFIRRGRRRPDGSRRRRSS